MIAHAAQKQLRNREEGQLGGLGREDIRDAHEQVGGFKGLEVRVEVEERYRLESRAVRAVERIRLNEAFEPGV